MNVGSSLPEYKQLQSSKPKRWITGEMKTHLKNLNLNRIRNFDKEEVRQTKHLLKKLLSDNLGKSSVLKDLSDERSLAKEDLKGAMQKLGHPLNDDQSKLRDRGRKPLRGRSSKLAFDDPIGQHRHERMSTPRLLTSATYCRARWLGLTSARRPPCGLLKDEHQVSLVLQASRLIAWEDRVCSEAFQ